MITNYSLIGIDSNAFSILGYVSKILKKEKLYKEASKYQKEAMSKDYNHLLMISQDYVDLANERANNK